MKFASPGVEKTTHHHHHQHSTISKHLQNQINHDRKHNRQRAIRPKQYNHAALEPRAHTRVANTILRDVDQDDAEANDDSGDEERLGRVQERGAERLGVEVEAGGDHGGIEEEEGDVEDEEDAAEGVEAWEAEGDCMFVLAFCVCLLHFRHF